MEKNPSSSRIDRKFIESNRRKEMKNLHHKLNSILPHQTSKEAISRPDRLEEATTYIKKLQINLEKMKEKKKLLLEEIQRQKKLMLKSPKIEIQQIGLILEVVLITGLNSQFLLNETIRILNEEGVDIVNASYKVNADSVFHSIHCQVQEFGNESARVYERLKKSMHDYQPNACL
ncbi:transcription factor bHLH162-like [Vicia villosa]|uniref:transcription factor bHLH162-like n=1 Tax=Vicia villosa TaxID=3911 RepID=UPI00273BCF24|nr:transcription factor bHLH162-like [Vicia villosa]